MESNLPSFPLRGSSLNIVRRCGPALGDVLRSKFGCVVTTDGVDFESDPSIAQQKKPTIVPQKRFSVELKSGVKVSVWRADLTNFRVDAVVNAANTQLKHGGGLALALSEAGGPRIQQDSDDYIRKNGELQTGRTIVSDAGLLPCKKIIHAVGPQLSGTSPNVSKAEPLLEMAIKGILDRVQENNFKTVAIPAISSGLFNYPLHQCAQTIVSTIKHYYKIHSYAGRVPDEIMLVNNDEPTVREMESACHQILATKMPMSYSQAAGSNGKHAAKTSTLTVKIGNVVLTLKKGKIEEQQTDVIVNTISPNRNLQNGKISKALAEKAGPGMQKEIHTITALPTGYVIATRGYNLHCKEVYHTCCFEDEKDTKQKILFQSVLDCLWNAVSSAHKSISFPAIGTGGLGLNKTDVAWKMSEAVVDFAQKNLRMIEVYFVIFPSDNDVYKAFEKEMMQIQQQASHPNFTHASEHKDDFHDIKPPTPQMSLISQSEEATHEAKQWLSGLLLNPPGTVHIYNNFIQHFGEKEYQQLSRLTRNGVSIQESFVKGRASITVKGHINEDVVVAGLQVEAMLCNIQEEFVTEEENTMFQMTTEKMFYERKTFDHNTKPQVSNVILDFKLKGLQVLKMEKVQNPALQRLFDLKKQQLNGIRPQLMFQRIPAQFCDMVCRIGFHAEYAPPEDPAFGEGIYFARKVDAAMKLWKEQNEEYLYFVEAEVLTGKSAHGRPGLILPPALDTDPQTLYNSVSGGGADIAVIFSGYQALPKHIITCKMVNDSFTRF